MVLLCRSFATFIRCTADMIQSWEGGVGIGTRRTNSLRVSREKSPDHKRFRARSSLAVGCFRVVEAGTSDYDGIIMWRLAISRTSELPCGHVTWANSEAPPPHCPLVVGWTYLCCDVIRLMNLYTVTLLQEKWNIYRKKKKRCFAQTSMGMSENVVSTCSPMMGIFLIFFRYSPDLKLFTLSVFKKNGLIWTTWNLLILLLCAVRLHCHTHTHAHTHTTTC